MNDEITIALERRVIELTEQVTMLQAWKDTICLPPKEANRLAFLKSQESIILGKTDEVLFVDEGEPVIDDESIASMILDEPTPEEIEYLKRVVSTPPIPYPPKEWYDEPAQPEIDWEKVAKSRLTSLKWEALPDHWKHAEIEAAKAAVAEYLRQVKEGGK